MNIIIWILAFLAWEMIGAAGFIFWSTREWDFTTKDIPVALGIGLVGPLSWVIGYTVYGDSIKPRIIVKKRL